MDKALRLLLVDIYPAGVEEFFQNFPEGCVTRPCF